ncbi:MAG TPA: hypothetical protein VJT31_08815 [Rugosimonospora sp.]|nr:hypothetical protein [Rugosimonospora sp.]
MKRTLTALLALAFVLPLAPAGTDAAHATVADSSRAIVLRPHRVDLVHNGRVARKLWLPAGPASLSTLVDRINDARYASRDGDVVTLHAALSQRPGSVLQVSAPLRALHLADTGTGPVYLAGTGATVVFADVAVASTTGTGTAPLSAHRPDIRYLNGSSVTTSHAVFTGLGSGPDRWGFVVASGSTLDAQDTTFQNGLRGLDLPAAGAVRLTRVRATGNTSAGIVVNRTRDLRLDTVTASGNGGSGLVLRGPVPALALARTASTGNGADGVELSAMGPAPVGPLTTEHNHAAGVVLRACLGCVLSHATSTSDGDGVAVQTGSAGAVVRGASVTHANGRGIRVAAPGARVESFTVTSAAGGTGIQLARTATHATVSAGTVTGGTYGIADNATDTAVSGVTVTDAATGIRVGGHADRVTITKATVDGADTGVTTTATVGSVTLIQLRTRQTGDYGVRSRARALTVISSQISGATVGLDLNRGTVNDSVVSGGALAIAVSAAGRGDLNRDSIHADVMAIRARPTGVAVLTDTTVGAPLGGRGIIVCRGRTHFPALPLSRLGLFAAIALAAAISLELLRKVRERGGSAATTAPSHVTNTA